MENFDESEDDLLLAYLENRLPPGPRRAFEARLETDAELRRALESERALLNGLLQGFRNDVLPEARRIAQAVSGRAARRRFWRRFGAGAGILLLAAGLIWFGLRRFSSDEKTGQPTEIGPQQNPGGFIDPKIPSPAAPETEPPLENGTEKNPGGFSNPKTESPAPPKPTPPVASVPEKKPGPKTGGEPLVGAVRPFSGNIPGVEITVFQGRASAAPLPDFKLKILPGNDPAQRIARFSGQNLTLYLPPGETTDFSKSKILKTRDAAGAARFFLKTAEGQIFRLPPDGGPTAPIALETDPALLPILEQN